MTSIAESDTEPLSRPGRRRDDIRKQAILDAAVELVAEVGYDRMSMDAVAARAHASKATIYRWWTGKAALVAEAVRRRACPEVVCPPDTGSLRGDLLCAVRSIYETMTGLDGTLLFGLMLATRSDPELARIMRTQMLDTKERVSQELVRRAVERGELTAGVNFHLLHEVAPAVVLMNLAMSPERLDGAFFSHLVDDILLPLLTAGHVPAH